MPQSHNLILGVLCLKNCLDSLNPVLQIDRVHLGTLKKNLDKFGNNQGLRYCFHSMTLISLLYTR